MIFGLQLISKDYTVAQPDEEKETYDDGRVGGGGGGGGGGSGGDGEDDVDNDHNQVSLQNALTSRRLPALTS